MDPAMPIIVGAVLGILLLGVLMQRVKQPSVVGYLLAGVAIGPHGLALLVDQVTIARMGEFGVVLLLFFAGMEIQLPKLISNWRVSVLGTLAQIGVSLAVTFSLGAMLGWPWQRSLLLGFVISLSSTAVVLKLLSTSRESDSPTGRDVIGVLLAQDIFVVPMLICLGLLAGEKPSLSQAIGQLVGGVLVIALFVYLARGNSIPLRVRNWFGQDRELELFGAFTLCFAFASLTGFLGLSVALGGFVAGIVVSANDEHEWVHESLKPLHVLFVALFFVSIGMLIDLRFVAMHLPALASLVAAALLGNTLINALILKVSGRTWANSLYGGSLLAMIGEFSFVLAAVGKQAGIIAGYGYELTVAVIATTLIVSPFWISLVRRLTRPPDRTI